MDDNSMSERILKKIEYIINHDSDLQEFTIVPTEENTSNKSPVLYMDHNLGLESWCVKYVYRHACADLFEVRSKLAKRKLSYPNMEKLNYLLMGALLIHPDVSTFWAMKRELVQADVISAEQELFFLKIVLSYKSKSNEAFSHRRWLLKRILQKAHVNQAERVNYLLHNEFLVTEMAANKSPNNYHCWNHRIWCMENLGSNCENIETIIQSELQLNSKWLTEHVSEHTGYHYRQYLIKLVKHLPNMKDFSLQYLASLTNVLKVKDPTSTLFNLLGISNKSLDDLHMTINVVSLLIYDLAVLLKNLNTFYEGHESLWYHRRFVIRELIKIMHEYSNTPFNVNNKVNDLYVKDEKNIIQSCLLSDNLSNSSENGEKLPKQKKVMPNKVESDVPLYFILIDLERDFVRKSCENKRNLVQIENARRHEQWLRLFLGINLV
ncbi:unnamed protein product [Brassicogethes aeneus]|uniref:Protein prenyltransferase alpha subunit repeat-containing protein 1 n=1 Tax=Brassicogethes aeneus TaxID=1431903 RepID=A0A9P0FEY3_BRAAE|nr:unnamed protein product [Brassicogethes aeneus]